LGEDVHHQLTVSGRRGHGPIRARVIVVTLALGLLAVGVALLVAPLTVSRPPTQQLDPEQVWGWLRTPGAGVATVELGYLEGGLGVRDQARELLALMEESPGRERYVVTFVTAEQAVLLACSYRDDAVVALQRHPDGTSSRQVWQGAIGTRLRQAAGGGSMSLTIAQRSIGPAQR